MKESGNILKENGIKGKEYPTKSFGKSIKKSGELVYKIIWKIYYKAYLTELRLC